MDEVKVYRDSFYPFIFFCMYLTIIILEDALRQHQRSWVLHQECLPDDLLALTNIPVL